MSAPRAGWFLLRCFWIAFIFFSSTSAAAEWADLAYYTIMSHAPGASFLGNQSALYLLADKGFHVFMFAILALVLARIFTGPTSILAIAFIVGACSEFLQSFFPGRDPAVRDVIINFSGATVGVCIHWLRKRGAAIHQLEYRRIGRNR